MLLSSHAGWDEVERASSKVKTLFYIVLPLSLLPPAMILYAGFNEGAKYFSAANQSTWIISSVIFLIGELITVPLIAWTIKNTAETHGIKSEYRSAFAVASISAVPMWLSSVILIAPKPLYVIAAGLVGLLASISLIYHGIKGLLHLHEEIEVASITYTTISLGIVAWILLITLIFIPLLLF
jgi:hypothetical protein